MPPGCDCRANATLEKVRQPMITMIAPFSSAPLTRRGRVNHPTLLAQLRTAGSARTDKPARDDGPKARAPKMLLRPRPRPTPAWVVLFQTSLKVRAELFELPKTDSLANFAHYVKVKVNVVVGVQDGGEEFSGCI